MVSDKEVAAFVTAYDDIVSGPFADYLRLSNQVGGEVAEQATMVETCLKLQRGFVLVILSSIVFTFKDHFEFERLN